jgi:hypothetical protein
MICSSSPHIPQTMILREPPRRSETDTTSEDSDATALFRFAAASFNCREPNLYRYNYRLSLWRTA